MAAAGITEGMLTLAETLLEVDEEFLLPELLPVSYVDRTKQEPR